jgi:hypothetical protein
MASWNVFDPKLKRDGKNFLAVTDDKKMREGVGMLP